MVRPVSDPSRNALIVAHEPDGPSGQVGVRLTDRGFSLHTHLVTDDYKQPQAFAPWPAFADFDLIVVMGSVRSLTNKAEISSWVGEEIADIRAAIERDQPVLGVCFGGQLIADAMGGSVEVSPTVEIGWHDVEPLKGAPSVIGDGPWFQWHHDRFHAPPAAQVLGRTTSSTQLMRLGRSVGTQFHPEVDVPHVQGFLRDAPADYLDEVGIVADAMIETMAAMQSDNSRRCHTLVDWFLDEIAFPVT